MAHSASSPTVDCRCGRLGAVCLPCPDTVNVDDILNVDVTPLSSISTSGPDMSAAMSVELGTSMAVDFDDRMREIHDTVGTPEIDDTTGARRLRNPS